MACRTAILCLLAVVLPTGCDRTGAPPRVTETGDRKVVGPVGDIPKGDRLAQPVAVEVDGKPIVQDQGCPGQARRVARDDLAGRTSIWPL
jgi:hypothetical protein